MINRREQPKIIIPTVGDTVVPEILRLSGGVPVYLIRDGEADLLRIEFVFNAGQAAEVKHLAATTANAMLTEGTEYHDAVAINELIDMTGASFLHQADKDTAGLIITTLQRKAEEVLSLAEEVLFHPSFPEKEFRMLIEKRIQSFLTNRQKTSVVAREEFYRAVFGNSNPYGRVTVLDDYKAIAPDDARVFHNSYYRRSNMYITVAGKDPDAALPVLEKHFACTVDEKWKPPLFPALKFEAASTGLIFTEVANSVQSSVRMGWRGLTRHHPDFQALQIANAILGGYFGSRLMRNIREDKGFTYGITSVAGALHNTGYITVFTDVANQYRDQTLSEIKKEIADLSVNEVSEEELNIVRNHIMGEMARMYDGPFSVAETIKGLIDYGCELDYYKKFEETVKTISPDKIKEIFSAYYKPEEAIEVIAGAK